LKKSTFHHFVLKLKGTFQRERALLNYNKSTFQGVKKANLFPPRKRPFSQNKSALFREKGYFSTLKVALSAKKANLFPPRKIPFFLKTKGHYSENRGTFQQQNGHFSAKTGHIMFLPVKSLFSLSNKGNFSEKKSNF